MILQPMARPNDSIVQKKCIKYRINSIPFFNKKKMRRPQLSFTFEYPSTFVWCRGISIITQFRTLRSPNP